MEYILVDDCLDRSGAVLLGVKRGGPGSPISFVQESNRRTIKKSQDLWKRIYTML
jgi:hypothetical protein